MSRDDPFVPGYEHNVFISYARADNRAAWVDALDEFLTRRIEELLGCRPHVWRDRRTRPGDELRATIDGAVEASAVFVTVLSPSFLMSGQCLTEVRHFKEQTARRSNGRVDRASRWIRVVKTPYRAGAEPPELREGAETIEERFFAQDADGQFEREFEPDTPEFRKHAERLAQSICGLLEKMRRKVAPPPPRRTPRVFLAETTADRRADRKFIRDDLGDDLGSDLGAPSFDLALPLSELEAAIDDELKGCTLSIHVLGATYGVRPDGEALRSLPRIQFERAVGVRRLVWIPEELPNVEAAQREFLAEVEGLADELLEVVRSGRQKFLEHVRDVMQRLAEPTVDPALGRAVYLVSEMGDLVRPQLREVVSCLLSEGFRVEQPVYEGTPEALEAEERQVLQETDATIIYFGGAPDLWVKSRRRELLRRLGDLNLVPSHLRAVYLCDPDTPMKRGTYMAFPENKMPEGQGPPLYVLGDCGTVACDKLRPLLQNLRGRANG